MKYGLLLAVCVALLSSMARAEVLTPGSALRVTFRCPVPQSPTPDSMQLNLGTVQVLQPFGVRSAALYDGSTLLGTYSSSTFGTHSGPLTLFPASQWRTATSLYTFSNPAVVDFTTIQSGTIHGAIEFTIQTGSVDIDLTQNQMSLLQGAIPFHIGVSPPPVVESAHIVRGMVREYCFGDGTGTACPCGNVDALGSHTGCASSLGFGSRLVARGSASVASDTLELLGSQMPNGTVLYFQGTTREGGTGSVFGDGLRCASGTVVHLATRRNALGASQYPVAGDPPISVRALVSAGDTRTYQGWYRSAAPFCTASVFNLTNGLLV